MSSLQTFSFYTSIKLNWMTDSPQSFLALFSPRQYRYRHHVLLNWLSSSLQGHSVKYNGTSERSWMRSKNALRAPKNLKMTVVLFLNSPTIVPKLQASFSDSLWLAFVNNRWKEHDTEHMVKSQLVRTHRLSFHSWIKEWILFTLLVDRSCCSYSEIDYFANDRKKCLPVSSLNNCNLIA